MLNSKFNNYNLYILVLGKKTLVKFIIEISAVKMYNFKKENFNSTYKSLLMPNTGNLFYKI